MNDIQISAFAINDLGSLFSLFSPSPDPVGEPLVPFAEHPAPSTYASRIVLYATLFSSVFDHFLVDFSVFFSLSKFMFQFLFGLFKFFFEFFSVLYFSLHP